MKSKISFFLPRDLVEKYQGKNGAWDFVGEEAFKQSRVVFSKLIDTDLYFEILDIGGKFLAHITSTSDCDCGGTHEYPADLLGEYLYRSNRGDFYKVSVFKDCDYKCNNCTTPHWVEPVTCRELGELWTYD